MVIIVIMIIIIIIVMIVFILFTVYCACLLASHGIPFGFETGSNPLFFTNVCDLSALKEEHKYVACKLAVFLTFTC